MTSAKQLTRHTVCLCLLAAWLSRNWMWFSSRVYSRQQTGGCVILCVMQCHWCRRGKKVASQQFSVAPRRSLGSIKRTVNHSRQHAGAGCRRNGFIQVSILRFKPHDSIFVGSWVKSGRSAKMHVADNYLCGFFVCLWLLSYVIDVVASCVMIMTTSTSIPHMVEQCRIYNTEHCLWPKVWGSVVFVMSENWRADWLVSGLHLSRINWFNQTSCRCLDKTSVGKPTFADT